MFYFVYVIISFNCMLVITGHQVDDTYFEHLDEGHQFRGRLLEITNLDIDSKCAMRFVCKFYKWY